MKWTSAILLLGLTTSALAQEYLMPKIPTEQEKIDALKLAYRMNGNSMVGGPNMIDLTNPKVLEAYRNSIATEVPETIPDSGPGIWPKLEKPSEPRVREAASDICSRHKMHKSIRGKSWRCVR